MNFIEGIIKSVPFFGHLNREEIDFLLKSGHATPVKMGQLVDLRKTNSFSIVVEGIFEIETPGKSDIVYLSPGSFFGSIPFSEIRRKGNVRALVDSRIFVLSEEELYRFFLSSHKAMRGYVRTLDKIGLELSDRALKYFTNKSKVTAVYSSQNQSGKSFFSSILALSLSKHDKTIVLDISYEGKSVFDFFQQKMTAPLSEKGVNGEAGELIIQDRIVHINENLDILNITFSSRVKIDPDIIGPVLFILSRDYRYIVADLSDDDPMLRDRFFAKSDFIFALNKGRNDMDYHGDLFDRTLQEGQRLYHVRNNYFSGSQGSFVGGLMLEKCDEYEKEPIPQTLRSFVDDGRVDAFSHIISGISKALVVQSAQRDAVLFSGFFLALSKSGKSMEYLYSSSHSYFLLSLFLLLSEKKLKNGLERFFSPEHLNKNLEISFPEKHVFKNSRILKYAEELAGNKNIEMFDMLPLCKMNCGDGRKILSTGALSRTMAASFVNAPLFEEIQIGRTNCSSGFPHIAVSPSDLYRTDVDEIIYLSLSNRERFTARDSHYMPLYASFLDQNQCCGQAEKLLADKNLVLEVSEREFRFDKILKNTLSYSEQLISKL